MIPFVRAVVPTLSGWYEAVSMSVLALLLTDDGQLDEAAELLAREKENGFTSLGRDPGALLYLSDWADVAASVGDNDAAQIPFAHLDPWSDRVVNFVAVAQGMVGRNVGRLECTLRTTNRRFASIEWRSGSTSWARRCGGHAHSPISRPPCSLGADPRTNIVRGDSSITPRRSLTARSRQRLDSIARRPVL
jgi:hypothetical protein